MVIADDSHSRRYRSGRFFPRFDRSKKGHRRVPLLLEYRLAGTDACCFDVVDRHHHHVVLVHQNSRGIVLRVGRIHTFRFRFRFRFDFRLGLCFPGTFGVGSGKQSGENGRIGGSRSVNMIRSRSEGLDATVKAMAMTMTMTMTTTTTKVGLRAGAPQCWPMPPLPLPLPLQLALRQWRGNSKCFRSHHEYRDDENDNDDPMHYPPEHRNPHVDIGNGISFSTSLAVAVAAAVSLVVVSWAGTRRYHRYCLSGGCCHSLGGGGGVIGPIYVSPAGRRGLVSYDVR
mmetsp:Transcript_7551/g.22088  ORF Transcript_7551/g.22088 Transcript_7551/m.22088 type:complete len:285 (+) Transcript_7551:1259-2113(+)